MEETIAKKLKRPALIREAPANKPIVAEEEQINAARAAAGAKPSLKSQLINWGANDTSSQDKIDKRQRPGAATAGDTLDELDFEDVFEDDEEGFGGGSDTEDPVAKAQRQKSGTRSTGASRTAVIYTNEDDVNAARRTLKRSVQQKRPGSGPAADAIDADDDLMELADDDLGDLGFDDDEEEEDEEEEEERERDSQRDGMREGEKIDAGLPRPGGPVGLVPDGAFGKFLAEQNLKMLSATPPPTSTSGVKRQTPASNTPAQAGTSKLTPQIKKIKLSVHRKTASDVTGSSATSVKPSAASVPQSASVSAAHSRQSSIGSASGISEGSPSSSGKTITSISKLLPIL